MARAYIGLGSNLGDRVANLRRGIDALSRVGEVTTRSSFYETKPWGVTGQPDYVNAVVEIETALAPRELLDALKQLEVTLGRVTGARWGPRTIDFDILIYDDLKVDEPGLVIPHPRMHERPFVLVPLAEIDPAYAGAASASSEGVAPMSPESSASEALAERVRSLAEAFVETDLIRLRIEREGERFEFGRPRVPARNGTPVPPPAVAVEVAPEPPHKRDVVKADLVGVFHVGRPAPHDGDVIANDRELGYVEALGIRNPVRSRGPGRVVAVLVKDGDAVDYGRPLFELERG